MITDEKADMLSEIKIDEIHFAWDRYEDKEKIQPLFKSFRKKSKVNNHDLQVYVLTGDRTHELTQEDLYRVKWLKDNGYAPYVMIYDKEHASKRLISFQRYVNNRYVFWSTDWEEYKRNGNN